MLKTAEEVKQWLAGTELGQLLAQTARPTSPDMLKRITEGVAMMAYEQGFEDGAARMKTLATSAIVRHNYVHVEPSVLPIELHALDHEGKIVGKIVNIGD